MSFVIAAITMLILDMLWLVVIANKLYFNALKPILRLSTTGSVSANIPAAIVVYIALVLGVVLFAAPKADGKLLAAFLWGGLFGLIVYATYDFTNLAVLKDWSLPISLIDSAWGFVLCGTTTLVTVWLTR